MDRWKTWEEERKYVHSFSEFWKNTSSEIMFFLLKNTKRNTKIKQTVDAAYFYTMKETPVQYGTLNTGF